MPNITANVACYCLPRNELAAQEGHCTFKIRRPTSRLPLRPSPGLQQALSSAPSPPSASDIFAAALFVTIYLYSFLISLRSCSSRKLERDSQSPLIPPIKRLSPCITPACIIPRSLTYPVTPYPHSYAHPSAFSTPIPGSAIYL